jgi:CubicO group peptidase (beta-lactamase class C family)
VPWPTDDWPGAGDLPAAAAQAIDEMFADAERFERTFAVLVVQGGQLVFERYADELEHWDEPNEAIDRHTPLLSWSMAKSILHAAVGIAVGDGRLDPAAPAAVPAWSGASDPRQAITLEHLLTMRDGLDFNEDYVDGDASDVIDMLFGTGQADVAAFATAKPLRATPDTLFNYSSGTSNIVARVLGDALGGEAATRAFLHDRLLAPIGMHHADPRFDDAGTFMGSSYVYAPAREFAKFGLLYLRDGVWDGLRLLPPGWVDHGRRQRSWDPVDQVGYGAHWWTTGDRHGTFRAAGYEGQMFVVSPALDLIVVRLGKTDAVHKADLAGWRAAMVDAFR